MHKSKSSIGSNSQATHHSEENSEHQQLLKALRESELLRELAELLAASLDPTHILQVLVKRTTEVCEVSRCAVWLLDDHQSGTPILTSSRTHAPAPLRFLPMAYHLSMHNIHQRVFQVADRIWHNSRIDFDHPLIERLLQEQGLLTIDDLHQQEGMQIIADKFYIRSILLVALIREDRPVGLMSLDNPGQFTEFTQDQRQLARAIGQQAAVAIDNAQLLAETRHAMALSNERSNTLNAVYNAMSDGLIVMDRQGQTILSNPMANKMLGLHTATNHDLAEFLQYRSVSTLSGEPIAPEDFPISRALCGEQVHGERFLSKDAQQNEIATEINIVPLLDSENNEIGIVSAFRDITEQVRSEQRLRRALLTMLHAAEAVSGIMEIDEILKRILAMSLTTLNSERGIIQLFDEETQTITPRASSGFTDEELTLWSTDYNQQLISSYNQIKLKEGRSILIGPDLEQTAGEESNQTMVLAVPITHQYHLVGLMLLDRSVVRHQEGRRRSQQGAVQGSHSLGAIEFNAWDIAVVEGIAQFAGLAIEEVQLQQEAKIARLNEASMRESNAQKDEVLAITAHEFRTPLTIILAHSQMITRILERHQQHKRYPHMKERLMESNTFITEQTRQLADIVNTFLEVTRLNRGLINLHRETFNITDFIADLIGHYSIASPIHTIDYQQQIAGPCLVAADRARLQQVFANLLQNAIKYSPQGGPITVTIADCAAPLATQDSDDETVHVDDGAQACTNGDTMITVTIADKGIGVPPADQIHLFESFYRASNIRTSQAGGVGLGLYVVAEFLRLHGGTIRVESSGINGEGSRFILTLPRVIQTESIV
jgi:PAS domain S-box